MDYAVSGEGDVLIVLVQWENIMAFIFPDISNPSIFYSRSSLRLFISVSPEK